jgi:4-hydroxy-tetrahydrodipicolinate synthase
MQGISAAIPTPVDATGAPLRDLFLAHCDWLLTNGCDGLNVLGSTGEANSFDTDTRETIMSWVAESANNTRLMVGTGTPSLAETVALTVHANDAGYGVALVLPPYYYKPASDEGLFRWYEALHRALGSRKIAVYFYNFPLMTGITLSISLIERLHWAFPDRFKGIKDSSGDLAYCRQLAHQIPGFKVFPSSETSLSEASASGFAGCISATVNHTAPLCGQIWSQRAAPPASLLAEVTAQRAVISSQPLVPAVKYLVGRRSNDVRWDTVIPPFMPLTDTHKNTLKNITDLTPVLAD